MSGWQPAPRAVLPTHRHAHHRVPVAKVRVARGLVFCPAVGDVFEAAVADAGIGNARFVFGGWPETTGVEGDIAIPTAAMLEKMPDGDVGQPFIDLGIL